MSQTPKPPCVTRLCDPDDSDATEKKNPTWNDIESAIRRLNGEDCTLLILGIGDPVPHMGIGGGGGGNYIVYATPDNLTFHNLINPKALKGKCELKAGGQYGDYDLRQCVSLDSVLRAAKTYAETGQIEATLTWEKR